jgi:hypothetical protein
MIKRDEYGFIVQHPDMDGGDTLCRTGIMALCGSYEDACLLYQFIADGADGYRRLVRHPKQQKWNDPKETSRDQVVCAAASKGLFRSILNYANQGRVNKDILDPGVRLYLYTSAKEKAPLWIRVLGKMNLLAALVWNTKIKPDEEMNQFACICIVMGKWYAQKLIEWHPDIEKNIMAYWSGWRDQPEIGQALIKKLKETADA